MTMIQEYKILLAQQGYDYEVDAVPANQEVVNVVDSDDDKEYIDKYINMHVIFIIFVVNTTLRCFL